MNLPTRVTLLTVSLILVFGQTLWAQNHEHGHDHHTHENHIDPKNEIGLANNLVYLGEEGEFAYGLHLHFIRNIGDSRFGYGLGYEQIFDEHTHRNVGVVASFKPIHHLVLNVSPGITFLGGDERETTWAVHLEVNYEFEIKTFHLGPLLEYAFTGHGYHICLGLHLAYAF